MPSPMRFVGGRPCLNFVNTVGGWTDRPVTDLPVDDKLEHYRDLVRWAELAGVLPPTLGRTLLRRAHIETGHARAVLARAVALRAAMRGIFLSVVHKRSPKPSDTAALERELARARSRQQLKYWKGSFKWTWGEEERSLDSILWAVSIQTADLVTSPEIARVRECGGVDCGWLFLDASRNHSRRWCDMQECGNRTKVRRFRTKVRHSRQRTRQSHSAARHTQPGD
jgi:predicted RNA-binding Zn ribbon-like protein